ncbi:MAG TPA: hypothetical protein VFU97_14975 [Xanthobacteraceae bacterium]|nr:hypothetical protein [Xanthobacteraceae bacterium]
MTSPAKLRANRRNAAKSTGPKTAAGRAKAARNARRHGLTLPVLGDPALSREVEDIARRIEVSVTGAAADSPGHAHACRIAETLIDLKRVRDAKLPVVAELHADPTNAMAPVRALARLDRYERRALWRRRLAVREFAAAVAPAADGGTGRPSKTNPTEKGQ